MRSLKQELEEIRERGLERSLRRLDSDQGTIVEVQGRKLLNFSSNNYLGLANDERLKGAAVAAIQEYGTGSGASRLITGSMRLHYQLEEKIAQFKNAPAALVFNSGYQANIGILTALLQEGDEVYSDELNHASIVDGCRLSRATIKIYRHCDMNHLEEILRVGAKHASPVQKNRRLIVTDSIFSMDGDKAPLKDLATLAEKYGAFLMVDEAHATGVFGPNGKGLVEECWPEKRPAYLEDYLIQMGTLGKALGSFGAYVAGSKDLIDLLINKARAFIYTTSLPSGVLAASLKAIEIVETEPERRKKLWENVELFLNMGTGGVRQGAPRMPAGLQVEDFRGMPQRQDPFKMSPIIPLIVGSSEKALQKSRQLFEKGFWVGAIRYPTVAKGSERLRITLMATHSPEQIKSLIKVLDENRDVIASETK